MKVRERVDQRCVPGIDVRNMPLFFVIPEESPPARSASGVYNSRCKGVQRAERMCVLRASQFQKYMEPRKWAGADNLLTHQRC